jgi:hypothetical protein
MTPGVARIEWATRPPTDRVGDHEIAFAQAATLERLAPNPASPGESQSLLAERILRAAARGERDPDRLRAQALSACTELKIASYRPASPVQRAEGFRFGYSEPCLLVVCVIFNERDLGLIGFRFID